MQSGQSAKTGIPAADCGQWTGDIYGFSTAAEEIKNFLKVDSCIFREPIICTGVENDARNGGRKRGQQARQFIKQLGGGGSRKALGYRISETNMFYD